MATLWKEGRRRGNTGVGDEEVHTIVYKISYKDVLYNMGNLKNYIEKLKKKSFLFP